MTTIGYKYLQTSIRRLKYYKDLGDKTLDQLDTIQLHYHPKGNSNSIATIVQYIAGNMLGRWADFLTKDGEKEWWQRGEEFDAHSCYDKQQVIATWQRGWKCFLEALESIMEDDLLKAVTIRGETITVIDAINQQLAYYPYHIGQMIYIARFLKGNSWRNLPVPKGESSYYISEEYIMDPAKMF